MTNRKKPPTVQEGFAYSVTYEKDGKWDHFVVQAPTLERARKLADEVIQKNGLDMTVNKVTAQRLMI